MMDFSPFYNAVPFDFLHHTERFVLLMAGLALFLALVLSFVRRPLWKRFALKCKWGARCVLFVATLIFVAPSAVLLPTFLLPREGVVFRFEDPSLTTTAIKIGMMRVLWPRQFEAEISPEKAKAARCVLAVSSLDADIFQQKCGDNLACYENIPPQIRESILGQIELSQKRDIPQLSKACQGVTPSDFD